MSETIKFTKDGPHGEYAVDDAGTLVGFSRVYTDQLCAIVRTSDNKYITAPLDAIEYDAE